MASKKTSATKKPTKDEKPNATQAAETSSARPVAHCPWPEHLWVDLESAQTELMKSLTPPSAALPVFSTRALEHGVQAAGAAGLRKGFSWNSQMDLAWALGYPKMTFIVDGAVETDSKDAILAFYGCTLKDIESRTWFEKSIDVHPGFMLRRAAFAVLDEIETEDHSFELSDEEFLEATEPRDLSLEDVRTILEKVSQPLWIERIALLLEALAGSSKVAQVLCDILQARASDEGKNGRFRAEIKPLLMAICRRLPPAEANALRERGAPDARALGMNAISKGRLGAAIWELQWADGVEDEAAQSFVESCRERIGDVPFPRYLFAGGETLIKEQVAVFDKYMDGPLVFFKEYSTIRHPLLTGPALLARAHKNFREGMTLWFSKHADFYRPLLEDLRSDPALGKHAADVLKKLG